MGVCVLVGSVLVLRAVVAISTIYMRKYIDLNSRNPKKSRFIYSPSPSDLRSASLCDGVMTHSKLYLCNVRMNICIITDVAIRGAGDRRIVDRDNQ